MKQYDISNASINNMSRSKNVSFMIVWEINKTVDTKNL